MCIRLCFIFLIAATNLCLVSCGDNTSHSDNKKAAAIYRETIELEAEVRAIIGSLQQVIARDRGRASYGIELEKIAKAMEEWERQAASPGAVDSDYLGHTHPPANGLTDEEMLVIQTEMNTKLNGISQELVRLMERMHQ